MMAFHLVEMLTPGTGWGIEDDGTLSWQHVWLLGAPWEPVVQVLCCLG